MNFTEAIASIKANHTNGINYDVTTDDIIAKLTQWSEQIKFEVTEVDHATVKLYLETLPENLAEFCQEVYEFCPDTIEQGYGCLGDMIEMSEEYGHEIPPEMLELMKGLDPSAEDFGLKAMEKDLPRVKALTLWWD